jgi:hypothetical protein
MTEDEPECSTLRMKMNTDLWMGIEKAESGEQALHARAVKELEYQGYKPDEIEAVSKDPVFIESVGENYRMCNRRFHGWRRSLPSSMKFRYTRLGTRTKHGAEKKEKAVAAEEAE